MTLLLKSDPTPSFASIVVTHRYLKLSTSSSTLPFHSTSVVSSWLSLNFDFITLIQRGRCEIRIFFYLCLFYVYKRQLFLCLSSRLNFSNFLGEDSREDIKAVEESAMRIYCEHSIVLNKGFALPRPPTIQEALDGIIPYRLVICI